MCFLYVPSPTFSLCLTISLLFPTSAGQTSSIRAFSSSIPEKKSLMNLWISST